MTSLSGATFSPVKDGCSPPPGRRSGTGKPPLRALYDLLVAPMEGVRPCHALHAASGSGLSFTLSPQGLMHGGGPVGRNRQLVLVLEGELYLIPFALLKGSSSNEFLYERFGLMAVPSLAALGAAAKAGGTETSAVWFEAASS